jgi:polyisoprenoid-binding protein YceI
MSTTQSAGTTQLPHAGTWTLDAGHTNATFSARHLGFAKVRGRFDTLEGTVKVADDPADSEVHVTIEAASISTNEPTRDGHMRSPDFLDVENFPTLEFHSTSIQGSGTEWTMTGDLTIRGVTRPVTLDVTYAGVMDNPFGPGRRAALEASTEIDRFDFGLVWQGPPELGGILVGKKVTIDIDVEMVAE